MVLVAAVVALEVVELVLSMVVSGNSRLHGINIF